MSDLIIRFYEILRLLVEHPDAKRDIDWRIRFFEKEVDSIEKMNPMYNEAQIMKQEIAICKRRRRSRKHYYNAAVIDWVWGSYMVSHSPVALREAWSNFYTEGYKSA